ALNAVGAGPESNPAAVIPAAAPSAAVRIAASPGDRQATVYWQRPDGDGGSALTAYTVSASPGGRAVTVPGHQTFATLTGLDNGVTYRFAVVAANGVGPGPASAPFGDAVPFGLPDAPVAVAATRGNGTAL